MFNKIRNFPWGRARRRCGASIVSPGMAAQLRIARWICDCFGRASLDDRGERAARLLEEAIELAQAESVPPDLARRLVDAVYAKPIGAPEQEAGGVGVCLLAWAQSAKVDLWAITEAEIARITAKTPAEFRRRHKIKSDAGLALPASIEGE